MTLTYLNNISTIHLQNDKDLLTLCEMHINKEFTKISIKNAKSRKKDWCIFCTDEIEIEEPKTEKNKMNKYKCIMHDELLHFDTAEQLIMHLETDLARLADGEILENGLFKSFLL